MVILNRLYSETELFDTIQFKAGINIIMGKYSGAEKSPDINGIGKSDVIRLIDLALLSDSRKKHFRQPKYRFLKGHSCSLDLTIGGVSYTIKRFFDDLGKAYFGKTSDRLIEYTENELKEILAQKLFMIDSYEGFIDSSWFRGLSRFYVKDDIDNRSRKDPINFIHQSSRLPDLLAYNFFLLGLPNRNIFEFGGLSQNLKDLQQVQRQLDHKLTEDTEEKNEDADRKVIDIERKIRELEEILKDYQLLKNYQDIEQELINITNQVREKSKLVRRLTRERETYWQTFQIELDTDIEKVTRLYQEVNQYLAEFVKHELDKIVIFRQEIVVNRRKFLQKRLQELENNINNLNKELIDLDTQRRKLLKFLDEREALDSLKNTYTILLEQKALYERYTSYTRQLKEQELKIAEAKEKISTTRKQVIQDRQASDKIVTELKTLFYDLIAEAIFEEGSEKVKFDIPTTTSGVPVHIEVDIPKSDAKARVEFKLLAYDLTVFLNTIHNQRNLPYFLVHDGLLDSVGPKTLVNTLNYIHKQLRLYSFQYIVTLNEHKVSISPEIGQFQFDLAEQIIASFEDCPDKMFFKQSF